MMMMMEMIMMKITTFIIMQRRRRILEITISIVLFFVSASDHGTWCFRSWSKHFSDAGMRL